MNWIWTILGQKPRLEKWENRSFSPGVDRGPIATDHVDVYDRDVGREEPGPPLPDGLHRRLAGEILDYHIFPPKLVASVCRRRPVEVGDAVGICYHFVPGLDLFFAARVIARFDEQAGECWRTGFTYRTLHGHPECGEETFSAEKNMQTG